MKKILVLFIGFSLFTINYSLFTKPVFAQTCPGTIPLTEACPAGCQDITIDQMTHSCILPAQPTTGQQTSQQTSQQKNQPLGFLEGLGPLGTIIQQLSTSHGQINPASNMLATVLSMVIGVITIVAGLFFLIQILIAGFNMISGSGDKNKVEEAKHKITNSIIGLTVVVAAFALTNLFGKILGIPNILDITAALTGLKIGP